MGFLHPGPMIAVVSSGDRVRAGVRERELIEYLFERPQAAQQVPDDLVRLCWVIERARGVRESAQCVTRFLAVDDRILKCRHCVSLATEVVSQVREVSPRVIRAGTGVARRR